MTNATLFLNVVLKSNNEHWYKSIQERLLDMKGVENVQIVKATEKVEAQITILYSLDLLSLNSLEKVIHESGAKIIEITIALESTVTGATGPYSASSVALLVEDGLSKIEGVRSAGISAHGTIKVELEPDNNNKQGVFTKVLREVFHIRIEHQGFLDEEHK